MEASGSLLSMMSMKSSLLLASFFRLPLCSSTQFYITVSISFAASFIEDKRLCKSKNSRNGIASDATKAPDRTASLFIVAIADPASSPFWTTLSRYLLGKSGLVFPKLTNITIHMNSSHSGNTRQNTNTK